jgi:FkbM family methyltransferase
MRTLRQIAGRFLRLALARTGHRLVSPLTIGHDVWNDVQNLSLARSIPIRTIFDVGANDGHTSLLLARRFPGAAIKAFEPSPKTFATLKSAIEHHSAIEAFELALGSKAQTQELYEYGVSVLSSLNPDANYIKRFPQQATRRPVTVETLDRFCRDHGIERIDLLKVDTEGFDLAVLQGASTLLERGGIAFVYVEFNDVETSDDSGALGPIARYLRPRGYRFVASYNDYLVTDGKIFNVSNALFAFDR